MNQLLHQHFVTWLSFAASFIICIMAVISACLVITVWILNLYHHSNDKPVPKWIKRIVLEWVAAMLCVKCGWSKSKVSAAKSNTMNNGEADMRSQASIEVHDVVTLPDKPGKEIILPDYVRAYILRGAETEICAAISDQNKSDWQSLARVMDRLFLIIFLFVMIIITITNYLAYKNEWITEWNQIFQVTLILLLIIQYKVRTMK